MLVAYDRDAAGDSAAAALAEKLTGAGFDCYRVQVPKGMDVNEYALQVTPASKSLGVALRSAVWLGRGQPKPLATTVALPSTAPTVEVREPVPSLPLVAVPTPAFEPLPMVLPASPLPAAPHTELPDAEESDNEVVMTLGDRRYRLRGLDKNGSFDVLKVNVLVARGETVHVDSFDLYQSRARAGFIKQAALELGVAEDVIKADLSRVLLKCEALQDVALRAALTPKAPPTLSEAEMAAALALLKDPELLAQIVADFAACGMVGEATNHERCDQETAP